MNTMYYDAIAHNNTGIHSMIMNEYDDANRYFQTSLRYVQGLVGSNQHQQQQQHRTTNNINERSNAKRNENNNNSITTTCQLPLSRTSTTEISSLKSSCTDRCINNTKQCDNILLNTMTITSSNTIDSTTTPYDNIMALEDENISVFLQFRPILIEMPMAFTSMGISHHHMNILDILSCITLYNTAICIILNDMDKKVSLSSSSIRLGNNIIEYGDDIHHDKDQRNMAFQVLIISHSIIRDILSSLYSIEEDSIKLWLCAHQIEYRILSVMIHLIQGNNGHHHTSRHHHVPMLTSLPDEYDQLVRRFNYLQTVLRQDQNAMHVLFETNNNTNVPPCA